MKPSRSVALDAAVDAFATYRLTKLLQEDDVPPLPRLRGVFMQRFGSTPWGQLADCPWCLSMWCGAAVVVARRVSPRLWNSVASILAASAATGLLSLAASALEREPPVVEVPRRKG
jgi:Protein of unknown function (DUF1360)